MYTYSSLSLGVRVRAVHEQPAEDALGEDHAAHPEGRLARQARRLRRHEHAGRPARRGRPGQAAPAGLDRVPRAQTQVQGAAEAIAVNR